MPAAGRTTTSGEIEVSFGDTAAAKTLFAIRPEAVPPWDEPIRLAFGWGPIDAERFERFLLTVRDTIRGLADRLASNVADLPALFGRPNSSAVKVVDEYLWIRVTKGL